MALDYDFSGPFAQALLVTESGDIWPLWSNLQADGSPTDTGKDLKSKHNIGTLAYVTQISVDFQLAYIPVITVVLNPTFDDGRALLESDLIEFGRSRLRVQFGYSSGSPSGPCLSPVFEGLTQPPEVDISTDMTITLRAQGMGVYSAVNTERSKQLNGLTREAALKICAAGPDKTNPRKLEIDVSEVSKDPEAKKLMFEDKINESTGQMTDWWLINKLVREAQCWHIVQTDAEKQVEVIKIFPRNTATERKPKYRLALFDYPEGRIGPAAGVFPIISVSAPPNAVFLPASTRGLVAKGITSTDKQPKAVSADDKTVAPARTGEGAASVPASPQTPGSDDTTKDGQTMFPVDIANDAGAESKQRSEYLAGIQNMGIKLDITTMGMPDVNPGDVMQVEGLGKRLDGNYVVFNISHAISGDGYTTSLSVISNTTKMIMNYQKVLAAGKANKEEAPPGEKQGEVTKAATPQQGAGVQR